ncbi:unnamed protein product [Rhizophagus irregularis]|nr:unnamed protein product [Rhizophagus irregularis]CAB4441803.1 unnamed protein product [Rhizophagus irregularis]
MDRIAPWTFQNEVDAKEQPVFIGSKLVLFVKMFYGNEVSDSVFNVQKTYLNKNQFQPFLKILPKQYQRENNKMTIFEFHETFGLTKWAVCLWTD